MKDRIDPTVSKEKSSSKIMYNRINLGIYSILFILHCTEKCLYKLLHNSTHAHQNISHSNIRSGAGVQLAILCFVS